MSKLRVYLAGPRREMGRVLRYAERLELGGPLEIVDRWWLRHDGNDARLARIDQVAVTRVQESHLRETDVLWVLWPETVSHGTAYELGYYRGVMGPSKGIIVLTGRTAADCVFTGIADYRDTSDDLGFVEVLRLARNLAGREEKP